MRSGPGKVRAGETDLGSQGEEIVVGLSGVRYVYPGGLVGVDGVDLEVRKGEWVALVGANGSGKSTLLKIMAGLLAPEEGSVLLFGEPFPGGGGRDVEARLRPRIGLVFQDPDVQLFASTVLEDVAFGPLQFGLAREAAIARARDALKLVGAEGLEARAPYQLSAGQKKRVAVATVLSYSPELYLLDEVEAALDPRARRSLLGLFRRLHAAGATVVHATQDLERAAEAERVVVMKGGRVLAVGTWEKISAKREVLEEAGLLEG